MMRVALLALLALGACTRTEGSAAAGPKTTEHEREEKHEGEGHEGEGHEELPTIVRLPEGVLRASGIKVAPARVEALLPTLDLTGEVKTDPDLTAVLVTQVPGRIVEVRFKDGDRVKRGDVLAVIESAELARARATETAAQAKAEAARRNVKRLEALAEGGMATGQERTSAEAEASALEAEAAAARQALAAFGAGATEPGNPSRLSVRAPIDGSVLSRDAVVGQIVGAEHELGRVANLDRAFFVAQLFEKNLASITVGRRADVRLNAYPHEVFPGTVESIGKQLDPTARTVVARIAIRNRKDLLKIGLFGNARVVLEGQGDRQKRLVVPQSAVTRVGDRDVVFVQLPDQSFELHPVTLGEAAGGLVEVLGGLAEHEPVVVEGVFSLKSVVLKSTFGEEGHH